MNAKELKQPIGFLTVIPVPELGFCGGYLLVNSLGRPVEFHCTAPVQENRTQKILYGKTYSTFLFCDQIGRALVAKSKQATRMIIADRPELAGMSESLEQPFLILKSEDSEIQEFGAAGSEGSFEIGEQTFVYLSSDSDEVQVAKACCQQLLKAIPLDEPFERIRQAIDEAQAVIR